MTKPFIKENTDGSIVITLKTGYEAAGTTTRIQEITMREPMVVDQQRARAVGGGDDVEQEQALLASLTSVTPAELQTMTARDYQRLQQGYNHFMD